MAQASVVGRQPYGLTDVQTPPLPMGGPLLRAITQRELRDATELSEIDATITKCEYVGSYSWLTDKKPTILVPGE